MNLAQITGAIGLQLLNRLFAGATLTMYSGTQPTSPETALSGNTALVAWTFASTPFGGPTYASGKMTATATLSTASANPTTNGTATFARATIATTAWVASTATAYGAIRSNGGNDYLAVGAGTTASSGGPTTTAEGITDGTVTWNYIGPTSAAVLADYTVGTSGADINLGSTTISVGVPVSFSSFTQSVPAV